MGYFSVDVVVKKIQKDVGSYQGFAKSNTIEMVIDFRVKVQSITHPTLMNEEKIPTKCCSYHIAERPKSVKKVF